MLYTINIGRASHRKTSIFSSGKTVYHHRNQCWRSWTRLKCEIIRIFMTKHCCLLSDYIVKPKPCKILNIQLRQLQILLSVLLGFVGSVLFVCFCAFFVLPFFHSSLVTVYSAHFDQLTISKACYRPGGQQQHLTLSSSDRRHRCRLAGMCAVTRINVEC